MRTPRISILVALLLAGGCWDFPQERLPLDGQLADGPRADGSHSDGPLRADAGLALGSSCKTPSECASKKCVEGVCCDDQCADRCKSCTLTGSRGRCTQAPAGYVCGPGTCKNNDTALAGHRLCDSGGACVKATTDLNCAPFACDAVAGLCYRSCTAANQGSACPGYYACDSSSSTCFSSCQNKHQCKDTGTCAKPNCVKN
jgi:hypothetical protein